MKELRKRVARIVRRGVLWGDRHVPRGARSVLGILCIGGGIVGFLPMLGFWMIPLGLALIALDIAPLRRRLLAWAERRSAEDGDGPA